MGLDMYLHRKRYVYGTNGKIVDVQFDKFGISNGHSITDNVAYWRKANHIHSWFVDNVQYGNDDCKDYYVSANQLQELYDLCNNILKKLDGKKFYITDEKYEEYKKSHYAYKPEEKFTLKKEFVFHNRNLEYVFDKFDLWCYKVELGDDLTEYIKDNLPTREGFFFGSTEIDGGYFQDVIKTVLMFKPLIRQIKEDKKNKYYNYDFEYSASW